MPPALRKGRSLESSPARSRSPGSVKELAREAKCEGKAAGMDDDTSELARVLEELDAAARANAMHAERAVALAAQAAELAGQIASTAGGSVRVVAQAAALANEACRIVKALGITKEELLDPMARQDPIKSAKKGAHAAKSRVKKAITKKEEGEWDPSGDAADKDLQLAYYTKNERRAQLKEVLDGKREFVLWAGKKITASDLEVSKQKWRGIVIKSQSKLSKDRYSKSCGLGLWTEAIKQAKRELGLSGFVPVGGQSAVGRAVHARAKACWSRLKERQAKGEPIPEFDMGPTSASSAKRESANKLEPVKKEVPETLPTSLPSSSSGAASSSMPAQRAGGSPG